MRPSRSPRSAARRALWHPAWLLALALLLSQTLGVLHGYVHGPQSSAASARAFAQPAAQQPQLGGVLEALFANHHGDADCRLYDQLGHADAAPAVAALLLAAVLPVFIADLGIGETAVRCTAPFLARGPPATR